ncbi:MAG: hydantoinase/oxoprolinase family protein [Hyphomicrobiaceae bacterium]|nr:hydantoinase/oxoprolinase family protein [Hyphomicrobiaceae bacterium]
MEPPTPGLRLAVDIGGTFTDIVLDSGPERFPTKVLTTPAAPERAVVDGTSAILAGARKTFADVRLFVHGTTLATNAIIERKGARAALIATEGFRDVLEIADESRFDQYDVFIEKPQPLVPRRLRFTVPERLDVHGSVKLPLDEAAVARVAERLLAERIEAVAIALIHAYVNPMHEERIRAILQERCPGLSITLSSEVCPEAREYERTSTAVANAYVQPLMSGYLNRLEQAFRSNGCTAPIHLMTSGGSLASLRTAVSFPVRLIESGPAGGAILAARIAAERGEDRILSFDMGGTTAKICLIDHGRPFKARAFEVDRSSRFMKGSGFPLRIPVIEMVEIGAGGGSLARVDAMRRILVGPESAGAEPGPACYGRGGAEPTVTDADVALGKIDPARFAGGKIEIDGGKAAAALEDRIGNPLGLATEAAAYGVAEIVDENMANAARVHAVERGAEVRARTLVAFGGAAPLHAARLAEKLGVERIIVPADAGVGSAIGFLEAPAAFELVRSLYMRLDRFDAPSANALLQAMSSEASALASEAAGGRPLTEQRRAFMRYAGQGHEIPVELPGRPLTGDDLAALRQAFEAEYDRLFARHIPGAAIEIMSWVVLVSCAESRPDRLGAPPPRPAPTPAGTRDVFDARLGKKLEVPVLERARLQPGTRIAGPALIVEDGTSTYVSASFDALVDAGWALVLTAKAPEGRS